jgi:hypothetical protein
MKYSKGWANLSEACMKTTRRRMSEGLEGQYILARRLTLAFGCKKGSLRYGGPSTRSSGVDGKHTRLSLSLDIAPFPLSLRL